MPEQKTTPAALGLKLAALGGLFTTFCVAVDPINAFCFALVAYVVTARV
jgi:hypothetical protein